MSTWFTSFGITRPQAPARLLCLPGSGSGAAQFRPWCAPLAHVELHAAILPGRERRLQEAPIGNLAELLDRLLPAVAALADRPYFLLGHSMGALIAFELAHALAQRGLPLPRRLFVCGYRSPELPRRNRELHQLSDDDFIEALRGYGGTPEAVLSDRATMDLLLPMIRADFRLHETHQVRHGQPLPVPISAFAGDSDHLVAAADMAGWRNHSSRHFEMQHFPGGHFFVHEALEQVATALNRRIQDDLAGPGTAAA